MSLNETYKKELESYTPAALLNSLSNSISSPLFNMPVTVKGIFKKGKGVNYNGLYYDIVKDELSDTNITLVVPQKLRLDLAEGQLIEARAYVLKRITNATGRIDVVTTVTEILHREEKRFDEEAVAILEIIRQKTEIGYIDIDSIIKDKLYRQTPINITIIIGNTAIIDADIRHQLKDSAIIYNINYVKTNLTRTTDIIQTLHENDGADILVVARGGGENLQVFNNLELCKNALQLKSALVTAIGHAVDEPLLQKISDKHFITPTAFGQYLYDLHQRTVDELNNSKAQLINDISKQIEINFQAKLAELNTRLETTSQLKDETEKNMRNQLAIVQQNLTRSRTFNYILLLITLLTLGTLLYFLSPWAN